MEGAFKGGGTTGLHTHLPFSPHPIFIPCQTRSRSGCQAPFRGAHQAPSSPEPGEDGEHHRALPGTEPLVPSAPKPSGHTELSPATNSDVNCCPGTRQSLSLPWIQHSRVFNYFCSLSLIFLSLLGDKQAPASSPSQALCSSHHPTIVSRPVPRQKQRQPLMRHPPCPACGSKHAFGPRSHRPRRVPMVPRIQVHPRAAMGVSVLQPCAQPHNPERPGGGPARLHEHALGLNNQCCPSPHPSQA